VSLRDTSDPAALRDGADIPASPAQPSRDTHQIGRSSVIREAPSSVT
jgi:hypothetical protein